MMEKTLAFGMLLFALAALLMGCLAQWAAPASPGTNGTAIAPPLKPADVPSYNSTIDSEIDNLTKQLG